MPSNSNRSRQELRGEATVETLRRLDASGKTGSFEDLVALLLAKLIGQPVRRARAGSQEGKDALSDDGAIAIECKRYLASTRLSTRELISELEQAKAEHPDLQLWILATTTSLGANEKEKLEKAAHSKGVAVLHLDATVTGPYLAVTPAIAALCATQVESTLEFLSGVAHASAKPKLRRELEVIRSHPQFDSWMAWLRDEIRNRLPIWRFVTQRQNEALAMRVLETAYTAFGTRYDVRLAVPRQASAKLNEWFDAAITVENPKTPPVAVVTGERYDGKTWLVYQWLLEVAERSPIPIFFVSSERGVQSDRGLIDLIVTDLTPALKREAPYTGAFVQNHRSRDVGNTPWALIVLDGLNEYAPNHVAWLRHLEVALGRGESESRSAVVLITVRARSWPELKALLPPVEDSSGRSLASLMVEIPLGPFNEEEIQGALARLGLPEDFLEGLSQSARQLAHRPRYLALVAKYRQELGDFAAVTPEVLHWLDLRDKVGHTRPGTSDWSPEQYQSFLRNLAEHWLDEKFLDEASVRELLGKVTEQVPGVLAELRSEGILSGEVGGYTVQPDRLTLGYGLFLRDSLFQAFRRGDVLKEILRNLLSPLVEGDEAVAALRAASTLMLIEIAVTPFGDVSQESLAILDALLWEWLNSRNLESNDLEAIHELRKLLPEFLLRQWREIWSTVHPNNRVREIAVLVFGDQVEEEGAIKDRLRAAVQDWFHLVPLEGGWRQKQRAKRELKTEEETAKPVTETLAALVWTRTDHIGLKHLGLEVVEGVDVLRLQGLGLYLVSRAPELIGPNGLLNLLVVRSILEERIDSGDSWVIRRACERVTHEWFGEAWSRLGQNPNPFYLEAFRKLLAVASRADLETFTKESTPDHNDEEPSSQKAYRPTKQNYKQLLGRFLVSPREVELLAKRLGTLLKDPSLPLPSPEQLQQLENALRKALSKRRFGHTSSPIPSPKRQIVTSTPLKSRKVARRIYYCHDLLRDDTEELLPVLTTWLPVLGTTFIEEMLQALPSCFQKEENIDLLELRGHAVLVRGKVRRALQRALRLIDPSREDGNIAQHDLTLALLPGATLQEMVTLVANEKQDFDDEDTFDLASVLLTEEDRPQLINLLVDAKDSSRKRRLRLLIAMAGKGRLPPNEVEAILGILAAGENEDDVLAAIMLAREADVKMEPNLLFPISRGEIAAETLGPDYASWLLVQRYDHENIKDHLDTYWRAISAARNSDDVAVFLNEISKVLLEYKNSQEIQPEWDHYNLPDEIARHLTKERVIEWTGAFDSWDGSGWQFWGGLIRPTFGWCLRHAAAEQAKILWHQVYPFQRRRFGGGSSLTIDGVDWVLVALNREDSDDDLAQYFLRELILDARTDLELFEIALGGYLRGGLRLREVAFKLIEQHQAERRARGVAILGWLVEGQNHLLTLAKHDPSLWVRRQAEIALWRHAVASWTRTYFDRFLTRRKVAERWAAGQQFLACADRRINAWAWKRAFREGKLQRRIKGEAFLLLMAAEDRTKKEAEELKSSILGHNINELSNVAYPWRRNDEWILARYGRRD